MQTTGAVQQMNHSANDHSLLHSGPLSAPLAACLLMGRCRRLPARKGHCRRLADGPLSVPMQTSSAKAVH
eukprot:10495654-Karenia_brevis.AAC.1